MKVLLAVSGGIDSMTMADIFVSHGHLYDALGLAHCNFHLRGEESDGDEALVESWARERSLTFHKADFDTLAYAETHSMSIEMAARELRYGWFCKLCREHGYDAVAVAHNANDNAETLLLNLLRGTGVRGAAGMSERDLLPYSDGSLILLRPLLGMTRAQIENYAAEHGVPYRTDSTNLESEYSRNRIRNEVFPQLERINPSFVRTLGRDMKHFAQAADVLDSWYAEHAPRVLEDGRIGIEALKAEPQWEYLLYRILDDYGFNESVLEDVKALIESGSETFSGKVFMSPEAMLVSSRGALLLSRLEAQENGLESLIIEKDGEYSFNGRGLRVELLPYSDNMPLKQPRGVIVADASQLRFPLLLRRWKEGDWLRPLGLGGKKKLSDLFTDLKSDLLSKSSAVVLCGSSFDDSHVLAVLGERIDEKIKVVPGRTTLILRISLI